MKRIKYIKKNESKKCINKYFKEIPIETKVLYLINRGYVQIEKFLDNNHDIIYSYHKIFYIPQYRFFLPQYYNSIPFDELLIN